MKPKRPAKTKALHQLPRRFDRLVRELRSFIIESRGQIVRAVDLAQAEHGAKLLPRLAVELTADIGRGFDASNLRYIRLFHLAFPNCDALRHELTWTRYRMLLRAEQALRWLHQ